MSDEQLADLMVIAKSIYRRRAIIGLEKDTQDSAARKLNALGVLSLSAISSIVGMSNYRVEKALSGQAKPTTRGHLNPAHLTMLLYTLSTKNLPDVWAEEMLEGGTSASTIADLTGVSESTIYRRKNK